MKKTFLIVTAALLSLSMNAASWTFTSIAQTDFYPAGEAPVDGNYWTINGSSSYQYKNQGTAEELYVADGQKFAPTEGLKFLTRGNTFRVFFNGSGIRLVSQTASGVNPSIVIPNCKAGSDLAITVKRDGENAATMAVSNALTSSLALDGSNQTYTSMVLTDGDVVINMSAGTGYVRNIEVTPRSVYAATTTKAVVTLFKDDVTGIETTCIARRGAQNYTIDGQAYNSVQPWQLGTTTNLTFRVKKAKKVTFVGRAANGRGFAVSLNGAAAENVTNSTGSEANVEKELTMEEDVVNIISITGVGGAVYPLAFIVEKDLEPIAPAMSGESLSFVQNAVIIYSGNIALSTVTNEVGKEGFSTASNIYLFTSSSEEGKTKALRVQGTSTITIAAPSNYVIEKIGIRAATAAASGERTIKVNGANGKNYGPVVANTESPNYEWELATPSNRLEVSTNGSMYLIITLFGYVNDYYPVTISGNWASFCAPQDVELPSGVYAYVADIVRDEEGDEDVLYINKVENSAIPANTGVFLYSETDGDYQLPYTLGAPAIAKNLFTGTVARTANPSTDTESGTTYSLYDDNGTVCLVRYTGAYIPANKAYLTYGGGGRAAAPRMRVHVGPYNTPTAIDEVQTSTAQTNKRFENGQLIIIRDGVKYNVQGQIVK